MFKRRITSDNLRYFQGFEAEGKRTVYSSLELLSYVSLQLWLLLPEHIRKINSSDQFKRTVRRWIVIPVHADCVRYTLKMYVFYKSLIDLLRKETKISMLVCEIRKFPLKLPI